MDEGDRGQVLVDSNIYIQLLRDGRDPVRVLADWIGSGDLVTCGMVRLEVERGIRLERIRKRMSALMSLMIDVPTTPRIWEDATRLAWKLDRKGIVLPSQDHLIATCALSIGAAILTDDAHFESIPGLRLVRLEGETG